MKTCSSFLPFARIEPLCRCFFSLILALLFVGSWRAQAANILWVSDANDPATGFFPAGSGYTDSGWVTLLQNAGHNVIRYNQPNAQGTLLTAAEIAALNTNDLIVMSRAVNSAALQTGQGNQWNTNITKPIIDLSAFHVRNSRLGWFSANEAPDGTPMSLTAVNANDPVTDYLFGGVDMKGLSTLLPYDEVTDRNSTPVLGTAVAGGTVYATATYVREDGNATPGTGNVIAGFPAGTPVRGGVDILSGYRMFFAGGTRESATAPNAIPSYTGRENLSPAGENIFLRAVQVALNNGVPPATNPLDPVGFTTDPASATVLQGRPVTFTVALTGAAPRTVEWQRDIGDGSTFTNIPGASTTFAASRITLSAVDLADSNAMFRVVAANLNNTATSAVATLTVMPDTAGPIVLSATSLEGTNVSVCYNEKPEPMSAQDSINYILADGMPGTAAISAILRPDGSTVDLATSQPLAPTFTLNISAIGDPYGNGGAAVDLNCVNRGFTPIDIGTLNPAGSQFACDANSFQVSGGGLDIGSTADAMRLVHKTVTGDFDARVRVTAITGTPDHLESTAKALLVARESTANNSAAVNVFITPLPPGDNSVSSSYRGTTGGATNNLGATFIPSGLPNGWMRIQRAGNVFTTYRSANGTDWVPLGSASIPLAQSLVVGVGAVSHRNGKVATGTFSDFTIATGPTITDLTFNMGSFSGSFDTEPGFGYQVQYKDNITNPMWQVLTTIPGDGTVKSFTDPGPAVLQRFYRVVIQ